MAAPGPGDASTGAALTSVTALPSALLAEVASVAAPTPESVTLTLRDGRTVIWGDAADGQTKAEVLPALLRQPGTRYDISTPTAVTVE